MSSTDWTTLIFAGEAILVSLVVAGSLFFLLRRARGQIAHLQAQVELLSRRQAGIFLEREIANTREMSRRAAPDDRKLQLLVRLRLRWLQLEQKVLQEEGGARSDTALLELSARPLLALVGEPAAAAPAPTPRSRNTARGSEPGSSDALKQARATILMQKEIIDQLKERLVKAQASANGFNSRTLDQVSENNDAQLASVAKLESELQAARVSYQQVSDELARLQSRGSHGGDALVVVTGGDNRLDVGSARTLLGGMENAHNESLGELRRMSETNARQRGLILELEKELAQMRVGSGEEQASQTLLDNLKRQLRDYENCTASLEMETENLRQRIATLNSIIESAERDGQVDVVADLQQQLAEVSALRLRSKLFASALKRLSEIAEVASVEQALVLLRSGFGGGGRQRFALLVKGAARQYSLTGDGEPIDSSIRHLLQSVVPGDVPWSDVKGGAVFVGATLRLFLESGNFSHEEFSRSCSALTPQLKVIDALLWLLDLRGNQPGEQLQLNNLLAQVARQLAAIDVQHHYLSEESARIGANLESELQQYFGTLQLSEIQRECVQAMLADFRAEVTLLAKASTAVHNNLRGVLQALDTERRVSP